MKNYYFTGMIGAALMFVSLNVNAQSQSLQVMNQEKEVLTIQTQLKNKQIALEKEKLDNAQILEKTNGLNKKSNENSLVLNSSKPGSAADDAKNAAKILKKTESANKELRKSNAKIASIQKDIDRLENKLNRLNYTVDVTKKD
jgi:inhibitor of KinA sporulation pathway (predicted exonuclease)